MGFIKSLKGRLTITVAIAIIVTGAVVLLFGYYMARSSLREQVYNSLAGVVSRTSSEISSLASSTESLGALAASGSELASNLALYVDGAGDPATLESQMANTLSDLRASMPDFVGSLLLFTLEGERVAATASSGSDADGLELVVGDLFSVVADGKVGHDYYEADGSVSMITMVPVYRPEPAVPVGAFAVVLPGSELEGVLAETSGLGAEGRVALSKTMGGDVVVLIPSGGEAGEQSDGVGLGLAVIDDESSSLPFSRAAQGSSGEGTGEIPGVGEVVYSYDFVPETGWGVTAVSDAKEAFAAIYWLRNVNVLVILVLVIGGCILAYLIASSLSRPIEDLQEGVQAFASGELGTRVDAGGGSTEVSALADEFNRMAEGLNDLYSNLERKVEERTRELQEANERLMQVDELKNDFISMASHELRSPLSSMKMGVSAVAKEVVGPLNEEQKTMLQIAERNIDRLNKISTDLLDLTRIEAGELDLLLDEHDLLELAGEVVAADAPAAREKKLSIEVSGGEGSLVCRCDRDRIIQVIQNLVSNAINYTEEGGITVAVRDKGDSIEVSVSDTGIGIPPESMESIFEKWSQAHAETRSEKRGTGLGLAICKGIVEAHHGSISVESDQGRGSTFTFMIPRQGPDERAEDDTGRR